MKISLSCFGGIFLSLLVLSAYASQPVLSGIDRLLTPEYVHLIKNKKIAIVANNGSVDRQGRSTVELLKRFPNTNVVAIFTPEHGYSVNEDDKVSDKEGEMIPVYSLYGPRKSPTTDQLSGVDVIVFDLETVGLRYYTYITTLALVMKAAKQENIPIIVLDRVNPLGGKNVSGAILDEKYVGNFASYYPIPTRYGLTMGELAQYYNRFFNIDSQLKIVPLKNWKRNYLFSDTDLTWHAPSPALPTFEQAFLYAIFGPFESLQLAVGRSQTNKNAFKQFGAPWISLEEANVLVSNLNKLKLPGLKFQVISWTPDRAQYENKVCHGFSIKITDIKEINTMKTFIGVAEVLYSQFQNKLRFSAINGMIGSADFRQAIENHESAEIIIEKLKKSNAQFMKQRESILIYD